MRQVVFMSDLDISNALPGTFWTHESMRDVFVEIDSDVEWLLDGGVTFRAAWWNRGASGKPFFIDIGDQVKISTADIPKWSPYARFTDNDGTGPVDL